MSTPSTPLGPTHRPALRPNLALQRIDGGFLLWDRFRIGQPVSLTRLGLEIAECFNGHRTLHEVQADLVRLTGRAPIPLDMIGGLAATLDDALLLQSPRFEKRISERISTPIRPPACVGVYPADPAKLRSQLRKVFTGPGGPGLPVGAPVPREAPHGRLRAALLPHMDYARGNVTYGWGFKELIEQTDAQVFVIVATSHHSIHRFTLTRQHFETPLGVVETDQAYINCLERAYGDGLFEDRLAHIPEHSIELEVVLLQFLLEGQRPFRIVPLLVGSFDDCVKDKTDPTNAADIGRMVAALKHAEAECPGPVCYLISGDLAHIGPKHGDRARAEGPWLEESRRQDDAILAQIERASSAGYFGVIAAEGNRRRICGLSPTYLTLEATQPRTGRVLHYQQYIDPQGHESVSFAAAAFYA